MDRAKSEADPIADAVKAADKRRAELMPDEKAAIRAMFDAWLRLTELGWTSAIHCPKDGTEFDAIEAGSTGIHRCLYQGKWPNGHWWIVDDGDLVPSWPVLCRTRLQRSVANEVGAAPEGQTQLARAESPKPAVVPLPANEGWESVKPEPPPEGIVVLVWMVEPGDLASRGLAEHAIYNNGTYWDLKGFDLESEGDWVVTHWRPELMGPDPDEFQRLAEFEEDTYPAVRRLMRGYAKHKRRGTLPAADPADNLSKGGGG